MTLHSVRFFLLFPLVFLPVMIRAETRWCGFKLISLDKVDQTRIRELEVYWSKVSRAVKEGDFEAYAATCHRDGVLVSGRKLTSEPLNAALARWKQGFVDTREGKMKASVEFRFSARIGDATTAHESGIFCYTSQMAGEEPKKEYIHLEALLVKQPDGWKILMEYQKGAATEGEWNALE
jgi:ketosteroid isomerase-like protein